MFHRNFGSHLFPLEPYVSIEETLSDHSWSSSSCVSFNYLPPSTSLISSLTNAKFGLHKLPPAHHKHMSSSGDALRPRSRALKPGLIHLFFHPEQCFSLTNSSSIPPNHPDSSKIQTSEQAHCDLELGKRYLKVD